MNEYQLKGAERLKIILPPPFLSPDQFLQANLELWVRLSSHDYQNTLKNLRHQVVIALLTKGNDYD